MGDLEGITVVSLEQAVAAPFASSRLADAGARVIKLERREGDFARRYDNYVLGLSAYFVWLNRGKESAFINLRDPADLVFLEAMLAKADVFIQNLAPGATEKLGIESAALRAKFPALITCDITGYGSEGSYRDLKAYDLLIQAESGLALLTGTKDGAARVGVSVCDIACGMYAHQAILQALFARTRTGKGRGIEVSLFHSMADWMNVPYLQHRYGNHHPARSGLQHPTIAPYGAFECADGREIVISIQNENEWRVFCAKILGQSELSNDPRFESNVDRVRNRAELDGIIAAAFKSISRDELADALTAADVAFGRLSSLTDLEKHPQLRLATVETSAGTIELLAPPATSSDSSPALGRVPEAGEHNGPLRTEFSPLR